MDMVHQTGAGPEKLTLFFLETTGPPALHPRNQIWSQGVRGPAASPHLEVETSVHREDQGERRVK